jgi:hypothetical protein
MIALAPSIEDLLKAIRGKKPERGPVLSKFNHSGNISRHS